jgi:hypothetical protein
MVNVLNPEEKFTTTTVNKFPARVWDAAWKAGAVEVDRRDQRFVVMRMDFLAKALDDARHNRPQSLDDMLADYDRDAAKEDTSWFLNDSSEGRELL